MTDPTAKKNPPLRLPPALRDAIDREMGARMMRGERPTYGDLLTEAWNKSQAADTGQPAAIPALPGVLDGLTEHQQWQIHNLAEIMRADPQEAVFRLFNQALETAVSEWRKQRSHYPAASALPKRKTGTI